MEDLETPKRRQSGVTIVELMIAVLILTVGLLALAQLFVLATMSNSLATNLSEELNDAQRLIEDMQIVAWSDNDSIEDPTITCGDYTIYHFDDVKSQMYVWIVKKDGTLQNTSGVTMPSVPSDYTGMRPPSERSRLVVVQLVPKIADPRFSQTVTLSAVINGKN